MVPPPLATLLIDDSPASRAFLGGRLIALGHAVQLTGNGSDGVTALAGRPCDLNLSSAGEIRYFFDLLRYPAGRPGDAVNHHLPGHLS